MLSRRNFFRVAPAPFVARAASRAKPNIVLILMDDMGYRALSCYGNPHVETPHLDRLASQGTRFTQAYVTPQCTPTRASILSGQYTARNGMWHVIPWYGYPNARVTEPAFREQFPRDAFTVSKGLRAAGYATGLFGKWHLTTGPDGDYGSLRPQAAAHYGFDAVNRPFAPREFQTGDKAVDRLTDEAIAFIEQNRARPFFCYLAHHTTHLPLAVPEPLVRKYAARGYPGEGLNHATALACLEHMDTAIGRLLGRLDALDLTGNTMVMFLTDNGGVFRRFEAEPAPPAPGEPWRLRPNGMMLENSPLREGKGSAYEGGIRVPCIVRWPGTALPGAVNHTPIHAVDLLPTFLSAAGTGAPRQYISDGVDLAPVLKGRRIASRPLYFHMPLYDTIWAGTPCSVVRDGA
ncbi:MAG: sulfatase-like hydrolase/transferase, partial [Bryobacteraceae bacterium]|nr:sulfatase-like hydrolase/transferase [Bryobacteraceae bacterium]